MLHFPDPEFSSFLFYLFFCISFCFVFPSLFLPVIFFLNFSLRRLNGFRRHSRSPPQNKDFFVRVCISAVFVWKPRVAVAFGQSHRKLRDETDCAICWDRIRSVPSVSLAYVFFFSFFLSFIRDKRSSYLRFFFILSSFTSSFVLHLLVLLFIFGEMSKRGKFS